MPDVWIKREGRRREWIIVLVLTGVFAALAWRATRSLNPLWDEVTDHQIACALLEHPLTGGGLDGSQARLPMYVTAAAYALAGPSAQDLARQRAEQAGAVDVRVSEHRKEKIFHANDGVEVFLEAIVTAKAVGRPRYAGD